MSNGCTYKGVNYNLKAANCECYSSTLQNNENKENNEKEKVSFKTITKSFISNLLYFNIDIIYCFNLFIDLDILKKNIGFYCMLISNLLQIIFLIIFLKKGLDSIKQYMINYSNRNEGKNIKNDINEINTKIEYKNRKIKSKIDDNKNSKKNNKKILIDSPSSFSQSKLLSKRQANVIGFMGQPIFQLDENYIILKEKKKEKEK